MIGSTLHRRLGIVIHLPRVFLHALVQYHWDFLGIGKRMVRAFRHRYLPHEAFEIGLLNPNTPLDNVKGTVSRSEMVQIQQRLNPQEWESVLQDKGIFSRICLAAGLPVPALYGLFFQKNAGWTVRGKVPQNSTEWEEFFLRECPEEFVVKPCRGAYGSGIVVVTRHENRFESHDGQSWDAPGLVGKLMGDKEYTSFVIQERLHNHPSLAAMGGGGVHSFRLVTYVDSGGFAKVVAADMKLIVGRSVVSNLAHGLHGNLIADIERTTGRLKKALIMDVEQGGYREVACHPDSGIALEGFQIPGWEKIVKVAVDAAGFFLPVRTVGWDIALSENGPRILEGNIWYDPSLSGYVSDYWALAYLE